MNLDGCSAGITVIDKRNNIACSVCAVLPRQVDFSFKKVFYGGFPRAGVSMSTMMWPRYPPGLPLASMVELSTQLSCDRDASVNISIMLTWVWWLGLEVALTLICHVLILLVF